MTTKASNGSMREEMAEQVEFLGSATGSNFVISSNYGFCVDFTDREQNKHFRQCYSIKVFLVQNKHEQNGVKTKYVPL